MHKEKNTVANSLARSCFSNDANLVVIIFLSFYVKKLLLDDEVGDANVRHLWDMALWCLLYLSKKKLRPWLY